jgi:FkbM family methyltransferase
MAKRTNIQELPGFHYLVHGRHGTFVANKNDIYVGGALITYGEFSDLETEFFQTVVDKDTTVVEIGANIGAHTVWLAKNSKRVIAVEPQPFIYYTLCSQIVLNSLQNVECVHSAIGSGSNSISIPKLDYSEVSNYGGLELRSTAKEQVVVPMCTLDELAKRYNITGKVFLKIDVEGMEAEVLRSGFEFIVDNKPIMYVENDRSEKAEELMKVISGLGYKTEQHRPLLFNAKNFFGKRDNKFVNPANGLPFASFNEICTPA